VVSTLIGVKMKRREFLKSASLIPPMLSFGLQQKTFADVGKNKKNVRNLDLGIKTGFTELDNILGDLRQYELVVISGRPVMGKSSLATNIATNIAIGQKVPVGYFSLDLSKNQLATRILSSTSRINYHYLRKGIVPEGSVNKLEEVLFSLDNAQIFIDDTSDLRIKELEVKATILKKKKA
jgi:replicative DNA helicase